MIKNIFCLVIICVFITACKEKEVSVADYMKRLKTENVFNKDVVVDSMQMRVSYRPKEFLALNELAGIYGSENFLKINDSVLSRESRKFSNGTYFEMRISSVDKKNLIQKVAHSQVEYSMILSELTYNMNNSFFCINKSGDTSRLVTYNYINTYGNGTDLKFVFVFDEKIFDRSESVSLVYIDPVFGIKSPVAFEFNIEELNKSLPKLKI